jgi:hypothetical protein
VLGIRAALPTHGRSDARRIPYRPPRRADLQVTAHLGGVVVRLTLSGKVGQSSTSSPCVAFSDPGSALQCRHRSSALARSHRNQLRHVTSPTAQVMHLSSGSIVVICCPAMRLGSWPLDLRSEIVVWTEIDLPRPIPEAQHDVTLSRCRMHLGSSAKQPSVTPERTNIRPSGRHSANNRRTPKSSSHQATPGNTRRA